MITGGARSGKSAFAEKLAGESGLKVLYLATAQAGDAEMAERINRHRSRRPAYFRTVEEPFYPHRVLEKEGAADTFILLDCLTLCLSNRFLREAERHRGPFPADESLGSAGLLTEAMERTLDYVKKLAVAAANTPSPVAVVTNEVGLGVVPDSLLGRAFQDLSGRANQIMAAAADRVWLVVCGIPRRLK